MVDSDGPGVVLGGVVQQLLDSELSWRMVTMGQVWLVSDCCCTAAGWMSWL